MKKILMAGLIGLALAGCSNGATDGNPRTDTTSMPPDTGLNKDTANQVNHNYGTAPSDTSQHQDSTNH